MANSEPRLSARGIVQFKPAWAALGNWKKLMAAHERAFAASIYKVVNRHGTELKEKLREDVRKSGMKRAARLAGAVRGKMFPKSPGSLRPAYVVGTNAPTIFQVQEQGASIRARGGALLIPIGVARQIKLPIGVPHTALVEEVRKRYGGQLVSQKSKKTGDLLLGVFTALQSGRSRFLPLFVLRRGVNVPGGRLKTTTIIKTSKSALPARLAADVPREWEAALAKRGVRLGPDGAVLG